MSVNRKRRQSGVKSSIDPTLSLDFLAGKGEVPALMRSLEWSRSPLGAPANWPQSLRFAVGTCLASSVPIAIYWGRELALLYNDAWRPIAGSKHPWALGRPGRQVWPEIWDAVGPVFQQVIASGTIARGQDQLLLMHRHGYVEECYFDYTLVPIRGDEGEIEGIFDAGIETTRRVIGERRARVLRDFAERTAAARSTEHACALAVESLSAATADIPFCLLYLLDADNPRPHARLAGAAGLEPGRAASPAVIELTTETDMAAPPSWPIPRVAETGRIEVIDNLADRFGVELPGGRWPEPAASALVVPIASAAYTEQPFGFLIAGLSPRRALDEEYRDFLERVAARITVALGHARTCEDERLALEQQLRDAQKIGAIGQLTGGVAHDFNNILTVIIGINEIVSDGVADRPELAAVVAMIDEAATRGAELTKLLLAFGRKQALHPRPIDTNTLVVDTTRLLRATLGEQIEIKTTLSDDAYPAMVDPAQLSSALINLAVNARDAMPNGGKLTLETANVIVDDRYRRIHPDAKPGPYVTVAVGDNGIGIPIALRDRVFEPFFTTKDVGKGTGLGLSMVSRFIKQSGGHVTMHSELGRGTTITLYLPRSSAAAADTDAMPSAAVRGGDETILVVEDDPLVRRQMVAQLASLGYAIASAVNGAAALALVDLGVTFDLLLTDMILPGGMTGRQLADELARRQPSLRVLYTSGYSEDAMRHDGRIEPGVGLLSKPYRKPELACKIRELLGPSRPDPAADL